MQGSGIDFLQNFVNLASVIDVLFVPYSLQTIVSIVSKTLSDISTSSPKSAKADLQSSFCINFIHFDFPIQFNEPTKSHLDIACNAGRASLIESSTSSEIGFRYRTLFPVPILTNKSKFMNGV